MELRKPLHHICAQFGHIWVHPEHKKEVLIHAHSFQCQDAVMEEFEEFDEDGLVDSDDDDNSWKVRRAALKAGRGDQIRVSFCNRWNCKVHFMSSTFHMRPGAGSYGQRIARQVQVRVVFCKESVFFLILKILGTKTKNFRQFKTIQL